MNLTTPQLIARAKRCKTVESRTLFTYPLCEYVPPKFSSLNKEQQQLEEISGLLGKHVAPHLKALSLLSFRVLPNEDEGNDSDETATNASMDSSRNQNMTSDLEDRMELGSDIWFSEPFEDIPLAKRRYNPATSSDAMIDNVTPELTDAESWNFLPTFNDAPDVNETVMAATEEQMWLLPPASSQHKGRKCLVIGLNKTLLHCSYKVCTTLRFLIYLPA